MRTDGYYWIKLYGQWEIAYWHGSGWIQGGENVREDRIDELTEERLQEPS